MKEAKFQQMMGKSHFKIGILAYTIVATVPVSIKLIETQTISVAGMLAAGVAALAVDADCNESQINRLNPIIGSAIKVTSGIEKMIKDILRMVFTFGIGALLIHYARPILKFSHSLPIRNMDQYAPAILYGLGALFIFLGFLGWRGEKIMRRLPLVGHFYRWALKMIRRGTAFLKRVLMVVLYVGAGLWIIIYNCYHSKTPGLFFIGLLLIGTGIFPHRTLLHSPEGVILFAFCAIYVSQKLGWNALAFPMIIGYASHLYLGDIFTMEGVPVSSLPMLLEKSGLDRHLKRFRLYRLIFKLLDLNLAIPIMRTGSRWGRIFEATYVGVLLLLSLQLLVSGNNTIRWI